MAALYALNPYNYLAAFLLVIIPNINVVINCLNCAGRADSNALCVAIKPTVKFMIEKYCNVIDVTTLSFA
jgi:hypothetical protein